MSKTFRLELDNQTEIVVETGKLAPQANGSATIQIGETMILATACAKKEAQDINFLPLQVVYSEKFYASGMFKHSPTNKREARPTDEKILMARVIDRTIRPMFPKGFTNSTQVMLTILSYDQQNEHDIVAGIGASVALSISDIPFNEPTAMVRVGLIDDQFVLNPTVDERENSALDLIVSSTEDAVVMIEAQASEIFEEKMLEAIDFGYLAGKKICQFIKQIATEVAPKKMDFIEPVPNLDLENTIKENFLEKIHNTIFDESLSKLERFGRFDELKAEAQELCQSQFNQDLEESDPNYLSETKIIATFDKIMKGVIRKEIITNEKRIKGRKLDEIRPLICEVDLLPRTHGSGLFQRGETQGLSVVTLGGPADKLLRTGIEGEKKVRYFHHYNFPPFSVGEVSNRLMTGNREIGHGSLAEKGLLPVIPSEENFPYTMRVVTEILSSNGSSSMAAACGSTLALMAAGVPIKAPVAGIAMGLMTDPETSTYKILTDLQDEEDFGGDMDFKVIGTESGITAIQMDIKIKGISMEIFKDALEKARLGRLQILEAIKKAISAPREQVSKYSPRIEILQISVDKIRDLIGKGGENINKIIDQTKVGIDIKEDGLVTVTGDLNTKMDEALVMIKKLTFVPKMGERYEAKVKKLLDFGAIVQTKEGTEGLVHISAISDRRINHPSDCLKEGQSVQVKLVEIDRNGRYKFSMR